MSRVKGKVEEKKRRAEEERRLRLAEQAAAWSKVESPPAIKAVRPTVVANQSEVHAEVDAVHSQGLQMEETYSGWKRDRQDEIVSLRESQRADDATFEASLSALSRRHTVTICRTDNSPRRSGSARSAIPER